MARLFPSFLLILVLCINVRAQLIAPNKQTVASQPGHNGNILISTACQRSLQKQFCINLLSSDRNSAKADLKGLAFIALRAAEKNATSTSLLIKQSLTKPGMDSQADLQQALSDCSDHYITAVELIEDATSTLVSNVQTDVNNFIRAAIADLDSCDAIIKDRKVNVQQVTQNNAVLRQIFNTAIEVADVAAKNQH